MIKKQKSSRTGKKQRVTPQGTAYVSLLSTADRIRTLFESVCAPFEVTRQQYNVLRILRGAEPEGLPTLTIAERMIEMTPGTTRMIDRLMAKGLASRETSQTDRRFVYCRITKKGLEVVQELDAPVKEFNKKAFCGLNKKEITTLIDLLEKTRAATEKRV